MPGILVLLLFALAQVAVVAFGYGIARVSEKRPRSAAILIGLVFVAGCASMFVGGEIAEDGRLVAYRLVSIGFLIVVVTVPSWGLIGESRRRQGIYHQRELGQLLLKYLGACWLTGIFFTPIFVGAMLVSAPPGTLR